MMNDLEMMILSQDDLKDITNRARRERNAAAAKFLQTAFASLAVKKSEKKAEAQADYQEAYLVAAE